MNVGVNDFQHRLDGRDLGVCNLKILDNFFGPNPIQNKLFRILWEYVHKYTRVYLAGSSFILVCTLDDSGIFLDSQYQGGVKSTVSEVFEDLKFKISEGYKKNCCFPVSAQLAVSVQLRQPTGQSQENFNFGPSLLKFST